MRKKSKRHWSDEQRAAAAERMRTRQAQKRHVISPVIEAAAAATIERVRAPEVQAVIDTMDPQRKAKLEMIQAKNLAVLAQTREGQEALARLEERKESTVFPPRPGSREVSVIVRNDGTMVSQYGPCICGAAKRQWHAICLKEDQHG
jgi:hypothetical protein